MEQLLVSEVVEFSDEDDSRQAIGATTTARPQTARKRHTGSSLRNSPKSSSDDSTIGVDHSVVENVVDHERVVCPSNDPPPVARTLTLWGGIAIVAGTMIGSGTRAGCS